MVTLPGDCHSTAKRCFAMTEYFVRKEQDFVYLQVKS